MGRLIGLLVRVTLDLIDRYQEILLPVGKPFVSVFRSKVNRSHYDFLDDIEKAALRSYSRVRRNLRSDLDRETWGEIAAATSVRWSS